MSTMLTGWRIHSYALHALVVAARAKSAGYEVVARGQMPTIKEVRRRYGVSTGRWMTVAEELDYLAKSVDAGVVWYKHECPFYEELAKDSEWVVMNACFMSRDRLDGWDRESEPPDCDEDFLVWRRHVDYGDPNDLAAVIQAIADGGLMDNCIVVRIDQM